MMGSLRRDELPDNPFTQFELWYSDAEISDDIKYAAAACLSTVDPDGWPEGRMVMIKEMNTRGFAFCTDMRSRKARALETTPRAALTFHWDPLERQIRIQGSIEEGTEEEADRFFQRRPRRSQITAWASEQSQPLEGRGHLETRMNELDEKFDGQTTIPRPSHWMVYWLIPESIEFWTARARRLHDRFIYRRTEENRWGLERLHP
jgi:pyridoxamine 5'-phosphate oxidase